MDANGRPHLLKSAAGALIWSRRGALVIAGLVIGNMHLVPKIPVTPDVLLTVLIPPLLFEGGLRLPPAYLRTHGGLMGLLALPGTAVTALAIGGVVHILLHLEIKSAMLLGAAVSAIDPVSVLALVREARLDPRLARSWRGKPCSTTASP